MEILWDGPYSRNKSACPHNVSFTIKPGLAKSLNSLESGRLLVSVHLNNADDVSEVEAELVNNARVKHIDIIQERSQLKRKVSVRALLSRVEGKSSWTGEISIPASWTEGSTRTFERTGSFTQNGTPEMFSLEISYLLSTGVRCTARFAAEDAFHWSPMK